VTYTFKTEPFAHQQKEYDYSKELVERGIFWEQGCGKSKITLDTAGHMEDCKEIDGLLVIAPNGVHLNWLTDEIPSHLPDDLVDRTQMHSYQSKKAKTKKHDRACEKVLKHKGFSVLTMTYDAIMTAKGAKLARQFFDERRVLQVLDESPRVKNPSAKRTIRVLASGKHASHRRILTGTPVANGPFDVYSQIKFLNPDYWKPHGLDSYSAFKATFGIFKTMTDPNSGRDFQMVVAYRNLPYLNQLLEPISSRVTKEDVLDLPPKLYSRRCFEMTPEQKRLYAQLKDDFEAELLTGEYIAAPLAIVRMLRFQQVTCGYLPVEDDHDPMRLIGEHNPRMSTLMEICEDLPHGCIIWARFTKDIDLIMEALGDKAVRYDGQVSDDDRAIAKKQFQDGKKQFFVANPAAGAEGITLTIAKTVIYYNNSFKLTDRLQSEDRAHRIGQEDPVHYIDIVADGTIDEKITESLVKKHNIASTIIGDRLKDWI